MIAHTEGGTSSASHPSAPVRLEAALLDVDETADSAPASRPYRVQDRKLVRA